MKHAFRAQDPNMVTNSQFAAAPEAAGKHSEKLVFDGAYAVLVAAALVLFGIEHNDPNDFRWLWIIALAGISLLQMSSRAIVLERISIDRLELSVLGFAAYAALTLAWTPDVLAGYALLSKFSLLAVIFLCLKNAGNSAWFNWLCIAIAASAAIVTGFAFLHIGGNEGGYGNHNFITEFLVLSVPFIAVLAFVYPHQAVRAAVAALILVVLIYLFFFNASKIEFLVIAGMSFAAIVIWGWQRNRMLAVAGALAVIAAVAAAVVYFWGAGHGFRDSIYPRLALIVNTLLMWWDKPLTGQGAGSFNYLYSLYQERHLAWMDIGTEIFAAKQVIAGAAHNEYVQLLATFGLIGMALAVTFAWLLLRGLSGRKMTPHAWCGLAASGVWMLNALVEFPLQNPATALLAAIGLGFLANHGQNHGQSDSGATATAAAKTRNSVLLTINLNQATKFLVLLAAIALVGVAGYGGYRFDAGSRHYFYAIQYLNKKPDYAYAQNYEAYQSYPWDTYIRNQLFVTTTRWYELTGKPPLTPDELDRLYAISASATPNTQVLLARMQYLLNSHLYQNNPRYAQELEQGFAQLRKTASRTPDVRLLDAYYRIVIKDYPGCAAELDVAEKMNLDPHQKQNLAMIRNALAQFVQAAQAQQQQSHK
jgi:hypothetical protein